MRGKQTGIGRRWLAVAAGLALAAGVAGCSTSKYGPAPQVAATPDYRYVIGAGDSIRLTMPLIEDLPALGRTPTELARDIEKELAKYVRDPMVTVIVSGASAPYSEQIRIIGEAARPQAIPYRQNMTILDVMIGVGGLTDFADGNKTVLVRGAEQGKQYTVRLNDLIKRGDISANVDMKPGDVLIIPQSWF